MDVAVRDSAATDIMERIRQAPMSLRQMLIVGLCVLVNILDGFDVLAMAFTAPAVASGWSLRPDAVGLLLSAGLAGMGIGALCLSPLADRIGRKPMTVGCLILIGLGMLGAAVSPTYGLLLTARVLTGVGIGGLISSITAIVVEYASTAARGTVMGLMALGFPFGATIGGIVAITLIRHHGWPVVFLSGGCATLLVVPLIFFLVPESADFLIAKGRAASLPRLNRILTIFGAPPLLQMPPADAPTPGSRFVDILRPPLLGQLAGVAFIMVLAMLSFYFILNWAPKLLVERGLTANAGITAGMLINIGGMVGGISTGLLLRVVSLRAAAICALAAMSIGIMLYGVLAGSAAALAPLALALGFVMYAVVVTTFMLMTTGFHPKMRATAVGICGTAGRVGSVLGPYLGGLLLTHGQTVGTICVVLALPSLLAAGFALLSRKMGAIRA
jgi:MFS family permease